MSLFPLNALDQVLPPSAAFVKKPPAPVADPPHPPYARYRTPWPSIAMEGWYEVYAGDIVTRTFGPNHGGVAGAAETGVATATSAAAARAPIRLSTIVRDAHPAHGGD